MYLPTAGKKLVAGFWRGGGGGVLLARGPQDDDAIKK